MSDQKVQAWIVADTGSLIDFNDYWMESQQTYSSLKVYPAIVIKALTVWLYAEDIGKPDEFHVTPVLMRSKWAGTL
jgi:hypothetical protein